MKKLLLSSLLLAFVSIFTFGCSSDSDSGSSSGNPSDSGPQTVEPSAPAENITEIDLNNKETLVGTYDIEFFFSDAMIAVLTNDCAKSTALGYSPTSKGVSCQNNENVTLKGEATIEKTADDKYQIITKVQMAGGVFDNPNNNAMISASKALLDNNKYNYTVYTPIPASEIGASGINVVEATAVKGTTGRNLTANTNSPEDTYSFKLQDGKLLNEMTSKVATDADVRVIMKKKNDNVIALDPNKPYKSPAITGFATTPAEAPAAQ